MKFNFKKIVAAVCMAAFLGLSFMPGISEAAHGRMSLAQAQQQIKKPLYRHYKPRQKHSLKQHKKHLQHRYEKHRPAMHTRGPVSQTWVPKRNSQPHRMKAHGKPFISHSSARHMHSRYSEW